MRRWWSSSVTGLTANESWFQSEDGCAAMRALGVDVAFGEDEPGDSREFEPALEFVSSPTGYVRDESNSSEGSRLPFDRLDVALANVPPEPDWYLDGYVAPAAVALIAGRPKVGKTTLVFGLIRALQDGTSFLGRRTRPAGVLVLSEEREPTLDEKRRIFGLGGDTHLLMRHAARATAWPSIVQEAVAYCEEQGLGVLVVDTLDKWCGLRGDAENSSGAVVEAIEPLLLAAGKGLAVVLVAHQRKSEGDHGDAVRGSNAIVGAVDVVIELERTRRSEALGDNVRLLRAVSRFSATPDELSCELGENGYVAIDLAAKRSETEQATLLDALASLGQATQAEIAERTGLPKGTVSTRLGELDGLVIREGEGRKGDPYRYRLADSFVSGRSQGDKTNARSPARSDRGGCEPLDAVVPEPLIQPTLSAHGKPQVIPAQVALDLDGSS